MLPTQVILLIDSRERSSVCFKSIEIAAEIGVGVGQLDKGVH